MGPLQRSIPLSSTFLPHEPALKGLLGNCKTKDVPRLTLKSNLSRTSPSLYFVKSVDATPLFFDLVFSGSNTKGIMAATNTGLIILRNQDRIAFTDKAFCKYLSHCDKPSTRFPANEQIKAVLFHPNLLCLKGNSLSNARRFIGKNVLMTAQRNYYLGNSPCRLNNFVSDILSLNPFHNFICLNPVSSECVNW